MMEKKLFTWLLALTGFFFWGCTEKEELAPVATVSSSETSNTVYDSKCCVRTQGYWKNHLSEWKCFKYDKFYYSKQTYYKVLTTPPKGGNAYYILAHQYIAAKLNLCACPKFKPDEKIKEALYKAKYLFENKKYTPQYIGELDGSSSLRKKFIELAEILDKFNNGKYGLPACK